MNTPISPRTAPRAVMVLACSLVVFQLLNDMLLSVILDASVAQVIQRGLRFLLVSLLAYFLWRGARLARWVTLALAALAVVASIVVFSALPEDVPILFRPWVVFMAVFNLVVALLLVTPSSITRHYASPR